MQLVVDFAKIGTTWFWVGLFCSK